MHYSGIIIRPPSEADSIILQVTTGCSHNKCTFCGTYKETAFSIKPDSQIMEDIMYASRWFQNQRRVFLCDGDAMVIPQKRLMKILTDIKAHLPWVTRVGTYANAKSLKLKTPDELKQLKDAGLGILYMGLETGDDETLKAIRKGASSEDMIRVGVKAKQAGFKLSLMVLLGIAGPLRSRIHADETARVLSEIDPEYVGALTLMLIPGTELYKRYQSGEFSLPEPMQLLMELRQMLSGTHLSRGLFYANHASNYLPIKARLPKQKQLALRYIDQAVEGKVPLTPEGFRAL